MKNRSTAKPLNSHSGLK